MSITLRPLQLPEDYEQLAQLLNQVWSEPTTAENLHDADRSFMIMDIHGWMRTDCLPDTIVSSRLQ